VTSTARSGLAASVRRLYTDVDPVISVAVAALLAANAFVGNGGLQLGSSTLVEVWVILAGAVLIAAAIVFVGFGPTVHGGATLAALAGLGALTALSILWSLHPADSWVETNRTFAYVAAFAAGVAAVRLAWNRWPAVLWGILLGLLAVSRSRELVACGLYASCLVALVDFVLVTLHRTPVERRGIPPLALHAAGIVGFALAGAVLQAGW